MWDRERAARELPDPKTLEELAPKVRRSLADFELFRGMFFARRPSPWGMRAAEVIVEALADKSEKTYIVMNVFPGSGKSTLMHDIKVWLISGGGVCDPAVGRALRIMQGSFTKKVSRDEVLRARRSLDLRRPYWDKEQRIQAQFVLGNEFGRFKPDVSVGDESIWAAEEFLVAQVGGIEVYEKEATLQAASRESGFLGERCDLAIWDDLVNTANSRNPEIAEQLAGWFEQEAETRVEPGGVVVLVGQRIGPNDLYRNRLNVVWIDEEGLERRIYHHIVFPAHRDADCHGDRHDQWNGFEGEGAEGCVTDASRLSWTEIQRLSTRPNTNYRTVFQQEDTDPGRVLVQEAWLRGEPDSEGYPSPGCYDHDRAFMQWPEGVGPLIDYCTVDPAAGKWWALEWWAVNPATQWRYLIYGKRERMKAGELLDWDNAKQEFTGLMHTMTVGSILAGHPIRVWIIEAKAAHKYLFEFEHYIRWRRMFPDVVVIPHQTNINKNDPTLGVEAALPSAYRQGIKRLPKAYHPEAMNYLKVKERELTTYPLAQTYDTVMADWFGEWNMRRILEIGQRPLGQKREINPGARLPEYLTRQTREFKYA